MYGRPNDLLERLKADPAFAKVKWSRVLDPKRYIGLAPQQTREYVREHVAPLLRGQGRSAARAVPVEV
jgi:adenylosuccinate lyase